MTHYDRDTYFTLRITAVFHTAADRIENYTHYRISQKTGLAVVSYLYYCSFTCSWVKVESVTKLAISFFIKKNV